MLLICAGSYGGDLSQFNTLSTRRSALLVVHHTHEHDQLLVAVGAAAHHEHGQHHVEVVGKTVCRVHTAEHGAEQDHEHCVVIVARVVHEHKRQHHIGVESAVALRHCLHQEHCFQIRAARIIAVITHHEQWQH